MSKISIDPAKTKPCVTRMEDVARNLKELSGTLDDIRGNLGYKIAGKERIAARLRDVSRQIVREENAVRSMRDGLERIVNQYQRTENANLGRVSTDASTTGDTGDSAYPTDEASLMDYIQTHEFKNAQEVLDLIFRLGLFIASPTLSMLYEIYRALSSKPKELPMPYSVDSILFDTDGSYGGNQGQMASDFRNSPERRRELLEDVRQYYPNMTLQQVYDYLCRLNNVGCGYTALANTLFMEYEGRPLEFERVFGYPMFKDGDLNYDRLILDIFATTDLAGFKDVEDGRPEGVRPTDAATIMNRFLEDKGVAVRGEVVNVTPENFKEVSKKGPIVVYYYSGSISSVDGTDSNHSISAHAMTVTGVTEDGRFIVSSWGRDYYLDPATINKANMEGNEADWFVQMQYNS